LFGWRYVVKGVTLLSELRRAGVKRYQAATELEIHGQDVVERLRFTHRGQSQEIACDTAFLHMGVVPNVQLSRASGLHHEWNEVQHCFRPILNEWGGSSAKRIYIAGDGAGISGAKGAEIAGRVSALKIAADLGKLPGPDLLHRAKPFQNMLARERAIRPFLDVAYPPSGEVIAPADETVICRCEEVTAGDIRRFAEMGCEGPNQTKAFGRPGMGPCQGSYCGLTVSSILAAAHDRTEQETGYYRIRPPVKPLTVDELARFQRVGDGENEGLKLG
jgi:NADPH-dependent 2,4-dienoyl-CoA reductase/sulfur reductase-like enzyme